MYPPITKIHLHVFAYSRAFASILVLMLSACSLVQPANDDMSEAMAEKNWQAQGKIAFRIGSRSQSAHFNWTNSGQDYHILLHGPLGQGAVRLQKSGQEHTLKDKEGSWAANSAENLLRQRLGWTLPLSGLRHWIKAQADPTLPLQTQERDPQTGRLNSLRQAGWHIQYLRYQSPPQHDLPRKIVAQFDDITLTLVIKSWQHHSGAL